MTQKRVPLKAGFRFKCQQCGECCRNRDGAFLTGEEITHLTKYGVPIYYKKEIIQVEGQKQAQILVIPVLPVVKENGVLQCFCLGTDENPNLCTIHRFRPMDCALFPFEVQTKFGKPYTPNDIRKLVGGIDLSDEETKEYVHTTTYESVGGQKITAHHFAVALTTTIISDKPCPGIGKGDALTEEEIMVFLDKKYDAFLHHPHNVQGCMAHYTQMFAGEFDIHFEPVEGFPELYRPRKRSWADVVNGAGKVKNARKKK